MTNVIEFIPRPRKTYKRLTNIEIERRGKAFVLTTQQLMAEVDRKRSWWNRFRLNLTRILGVHAAPVTSQESGSDKSLGGAA